MPNALPNKCARSRVGKNVTYLTPSEKRKFDVHLFHQFDVEMIRMFAKIMKIVGSLFHIDIMHG